MHFIIKKKGNWFPPRYKGCPPALVVLTPLPAANQIAEIREIWNRTPAWKIIYTRLPKR